MNNATPGAEPWPQVHPGILRGVRAAAAPVRAPCAAATDGLAGSTGRG